MFVFTSFLAVGHAADEEGEDSFSVSGDFRFRLENDFDSQTASGTKRDDRTRARVRARVTLSYKPSSPFSFGLRLRSGSEESQQSPHITVADFDNNDTGDSDFVFDKWFFRVANENSWAWVGRNSFPFWKQNELFWDDDVTPAGIAGGYKAGMVDITAGYFSLPAGMDKFAGNLGALQVALSGKSGELGIKGAIGFYNFDADPNDPDIVRFLSNNGLRDYQVWVGSFQLGMTAGDQPLKFGVDVMKNTEDYALTETARDEDTGFVAQVSYGQTKQPGDWLVAYYYARIEELAVNNSFSQDDWMRWGSATQTRSSNFKGHEVRFAYGLAKQLTLVARLYIVEAITTNEDGNRFRVDFNYKF